MISELLVRRLVIDLCRRAGSCCLWSPLP